MMNSNKIQKGKVCFCVKPIHILFLFVVVVSVVVILLIPQGTRFQGALVQPQVVEEKVGTIVVEYIKDADEVEVEDDSENVTLGKLAFKIGNEPIEITAITLELEGDTNNESFTDLSLLNHEDVDFVWLSTTTLLIDLSANPLVSDEYSDITLQASNLSVIAGNTSAFHFVDAVAIGVETAETITSLGVNGMLDPVPQVNKYK